MFLNDRFDCCGLWGLSELVNVEGSSRNDNIRITLLDAFVKAGISADIPAALVVYTVRNFEEHSGDAISDTIIQNNWGTVIKTKPAYNKNSGNYLVGYMWTPNEIFGKAIQNYTR